MKEIVKHDAAAPRIGIDLGGTKIAGIVLPPSGEVSLSLRVAAPRTDYAASVRAIVDVVRQLEEQAGTACSVGIGMPGSLSPVTGLVQNANSVWLNGKPLKADVEAALGRPVRFANDANCFALSEAADGAAAGARSVFGVIIGTGCGGGLVYAGQLVDGPQSIGGEWGHNPLPWATPEEHPGPRCWCGRYGCMETWVSGTGLELDHARVTGLQMPAVKIAEAAEAGDAAAQASLDRHASRLARGLAHVVNMFDPEVIVLGGGLSNLAHLYRVLPQLMPPHIFSDSPRVDIRAPRWGDASGVRGAARLWF
jgi:fructokinase